MESLEKYLEQLKECILAVIDSDQPSNKQVWELENYYEQAKIFCSQSNVSAALAILQRLRTLPETDTRMAAIRARAEGYSDAIQAITNSSRWAGVIQTKDSAQTLSITPLVEPIDNKVDIIPVEKSPQKVETAKRTRPPIDDI